MIDIKTRNALEQITCMLCKGKMQYKSETKKKIKMVCPTCLKSGITNEIQLELKDKKQDELDNFDLTADHGSNGKRTC